MKKVSIIIPTYNCLAYLPKAIESVFSQSYHNFELIIIDDNSNDGTASYLKSMTDKRIKVMTTTGIGASAARNLGIANSSGDYIAFLDADDYWYPEKLLLQVNLHDSNPDVAMSFTNYQHLTEEYQSIIDCFSYWGKFQDNNAASIIIENPLNLIIKNNIIGTSTVMLNASIVSNIEMFDVNAKYAEDWDLWLRICEKYKIAALNSVQVEYLVRHNSATLNQHYRLRNLQCLESIVNRYLDNSLYWNLSNATIKNVRARILEGYADYYRSQKEYKQAVKFSVRSLILAPERKRIRSLIGDCNKALSK